MSEKPTPADVSFGMAKETQTRREKINQLHEMTRAHAAPSVFFYVVALNGQPANSKPISLS